jgi:hypothetical protein
VKRPLYSALLKILATSAIGAFLYAVVLTLRAALFGTAGGFLPAAGFALAMGFGYLAGRRLLRSTPPFAIRISAARPVKFVLFMLGAKDAAGSVAAVTAWLLALLPLLAAFLAFAGSGFLRLPFELFVVILAYATALKHSLQPFSRIMSNYKAYAGFVFLALCLESLHFLESISYLRPWLLVISYYYILIYLLAKNQEDIDSNIFDKKHIEKSILPRNLRRFNTFWVCMLFLAVVLLFNLKPVIIWLLRLAAQISVFIISAVFWLASLLFTPTSTMESGGAATDPGFFGAAVEAIRPLQNLLSNTVKNAVLFYLAYRLLLSLAKWIPVLLRKLAEQIRRLFSFRKGEHSYETADYSDETETVKPVQEQEQKRSLKKKMKKSSRTLKGITDPVERVRFMYGSILSMLPLLGVRTEQSDTTADILKKASVSPQISDELAPFTGIYNCVRYGEQVPDGAALQRAEGHFDKAVEVLDGK